MLGALYDGNEMMRMTYLSSSPDTLSGYHALVLPCYDAVMLSCVSSISVHHIILIAACNN